MVIQISIFLTYFAFILIGALDCLAQSASETPRNSDIGWPVIHQNDRGSKEATASGPVKPVVFDAVRSAPPILMLLDQHYLYVQETLTGSIKRYLKNDLAAGVVDEFGVGKTWPFSGGGVIDQFGNSWWTGGNYLLRVSGNFEKFDSSAPFPAPGNDSTIWNHFYNSVNLLPDGQVLVSTMSPDMYLLDSQIDSSGKFPLVEVLRKTEFRFAGLQVFGSTDSYGPRPVTRNNRDFYLASSEALAKVAYDVSTKTFKRNAIWVFRNPQNIRAKRSNMAVSNPVLVGSLVCVATDPLFNTEYQKIYCLNSSDGKLVWAFTPFLTPGISAAHTLGAIEGKQQLFTIARSEDDSGGVAGFDLKTGKKLWPNVALSQISESFVIASGNNSLYASSINLATSRFELFRVDTVSGQRSIFQSFASSESPRASLGAIDPDGSLYFATPGGVTRYRDQR